MPAEGAATPAPVAGHRLVGHDAAERTLIASWAAGRLPHGWLFCGPRGIGKATLAQRFASFLLAEGPRRPGRAVPADLSLPEHHPVLARLRSGGRGDLTTIVREINPETKKLRPFIVVEQVRDLGRSLAMTSLEGGYRAVIVDAAEEMNENAQNALLKVLEEPPADAVMMLVSHAPGRLLPTVRSRCRRLTLNPLAPAQVAAVLAGLGAAPEPTDAAALAALAEGSPGRALALAESGGRGAYGELVDLLRDLPELDYEKAHKLSDRLAGRTADAQFRTWMELLALWIARLVRAAATGVAIEEAAPGERELGRRLGRGGLDRWIELWEKVGDLAARADRINLDRKQVILSALMAVEQTARG